MLGGFVPLDAIDSEPRLSGFVRRLERIGRVGLFNRRGIGLSDSVPLSNPPTIEDWVDHVIAVLDATGIESACVIAGLGDIKAIAAAARVPHRIEQLISINGAIRPLATVLGVGRPEIDQLFNESLRPGRDEIDAFDQLSWAAPSLKDDVAFRSWWDAAGRRGASPSTARALLAIIGNADVTAECESLECPILVIQRRDAAAFGVAAAEYFVAHSRRGRLRLLPDDLLCWVDAEGVLGEIEEALTGARSAPESERVMMTRSRLPWRAELVSISRRGSQRSPTPIRSSSRGPLPPFFWELISVSNRSVNTHSRAYPAPGSCSAWTEHLTDGPVPVGRGCQAPRSE